MESVGSLVFTSVFTAVAPLPAFVAHGLHVHMASEWHKQ